MRTVAGWLRALYWVLCFYMWGMKPPPDSDHGMIPDDLTDRKALEDAMVMAETEGVELGMVSVWTEGEKPCKGHCYHEVRTGSAHRRALKIVEEDIHKDYVCCRCTHGRCVTIRGKFLKSATAAVSMASGEAKWKKKREDADAGRQREEESLPS